MNRVTFCRSISLTADNVTETNLHNFEFESNGVINPNEVVFVVSRNSAPMTQTVFKHHLRLTSKLFYLGLKINNSSHQTLEYKKHTLLKNLLRHRAVKISCHVITAKDLHRAEIKTIQLNLMHTNMW